MTKRLALVLAVLALAGSVVAATRATGATTYNLTPIGMGYGDSVWNYDFTTQSGAGWNTVDWALSLLFYNNAEIDKVKGIVGGSYWFYGSTKYAYMNDGAGGLYDSDGGKKTDTPSCLGSSRHYRVYAPPSTDRMYNPSFGYYIFGTTHADHHELCNSWYDDSEGTEYNLYSKFSSKGYSSYYDWGYFYNYEWRDEGDHHWRNDGYTTYIRIT